MDFSIFLETNWRNDNNKMEYTRIPDKKAWPNRHKIQIECHIGWSNPSYGYKSKQLWVEEWVLLPKIDPRQIVIVQWENNNAWTEKTGLVHDSKLFITHWNQNYQYLFRNWSFSWFFNEKWPSFHEFKTCNKHHHNLSSLYH